MRKWIDFARIQFVFGEIYRKIDRFRPKYLLISKNYLFRDDTKSSQIGRTI